jgi:hypothetical protein
MGTSGRFRSGSKAAPNPEDDGSRERQDGLSSVGYEEADQHPGNQEELRSHSRPGLSLCTDSDERLAKKQTLNIPISFEKGCSEHFGKLAESKIHRESSGK